MRRATIPLLLLVGVLAVGFLWESGSAVITVHPEQEFQSMTGWEVTLRLWETNKSEDRFDDSWELYGPAIFDRLVNELGINRVRLELKSGVENSVDYWALFRGGKIGYREYKSHYYDKINDNDDPQLLNAAGVQFSMLDYQVEKMLLPIKQLVEANGEKLFINLCYVDFKGRGGSQGSLSHALAADEYAELIAASFDRLSSKYGIVPDALEVILEPDNSVDWRGEQIGNGLMAASRRLEVSGFKPDFIAPSTSHASRAPGYFDDMVSVPGVENVLSTLAYHRYDLVPDIITLPRIRKRAEKFGLRTAMLEGLHAGAAQLHADLTETNSSAWQQYGIAVQLAEDAELRSGYFYALQMDEKGNPNIVLSESGRELMHYFKFVRHGAIRLGATSSNDSQRAVAFRNIDGLSVVVIHSLRAADLTIQHLPEGNYGIRYTTSDQFHVPLPDRAIAAAENLEITMPDSGTVTVYQKM